MTVIGCRKECYNLGSRMWVEAQVSRGREGWGREEQELASYFRP